MPTNRLIVYVGGRNLPGSTLAQGGPGGWRGSGNQAWINKLWGRGEGNGARSAVDGASAYEFGPWGGSIAFDTPNSWNFSINSPPTGTQDDFLSVAIHELAHVLGFGIADSFDNLVQSSHRFYGTESASVHGANFVRLYTDDSHWADGTVSPAGGPDALMGRRINPGYRNIITPLDYAGLADVGWNVPNNLLYPVYTQGDFDFDVDGSDFLIWQENFGGPGPAGDADGDNDVDGHDFLAWQRNFGDGGGAGSGPSAAVPEPTTFALAALLIGALGMPPVGRSCRVLP